LKRINKSTANRCLVTQKCDGVALLVWRTP